LKLLHLVDSVSGADTTVKVERVEYPGGEVDLNIHQIEGVYGAVGEFDEAWDRDPKKDGLVNFISVSLVDGRRLVNALLEEIKG
jgi:hypothetical protein